MMSRWCRGCEVMIMIRKWDEKHEAPRRIYHTAACIPKHIVARRARSGRLIEKRNVIK
jgi:hypothetical protein